MTKSMRDEYDFDGARNNPYPSRQKERLIEFASARIKEIKKALKEADAGNASQLSAGAEFSLICE